MILVTGGTGFIGQVLIRQLVEAGYPVRVLIRPAPESPRLPRGIPLEIAVSSLADPRGLQAAMVGVRVVYHLVGAEWQGSGANLLEIDIQGTRAVTQAAVEAGVERIFSLSHLGADRASAYPVFKAKAIAEEHLRRSGIDFTIIRSALVFGPNDGFTTGLARLLFAMPYIFLLPGDGSTLLQPLWVEDLATCLVWSLEQEATRNVTYELGGPEYLSFRQILTMIMRAIGIERTLLPTRAPYLRALTVMLESVFPRLPVSTFWLDYLAANRTCALDTIPRSFGLLPSRFPTHLEYLAGQNWRRALWQTMRRRKPAQRKTPSTATHP